MNRKTLLPAALLALTSLAACGDDDSASQATTEETAAPVGATGGPEAPEETTADTEAPEETTADTEPPEETTEETTAATTADTTAATIDETTADTTGATTADTAGSASGDDSEVCAALRVISETDRRTNELLGTNGDFDEIKEFFREETDEVLAAYDRVAAAEPDLAEDVATLRDFTEASAEIIEESDGIGEFIPKILELPNVMEAGSAGLALNSYAEENCGFSTGNQAL